MDYIQENIKLYKDKNQLYGEGSPRNLWKREESQIRRFEQFSRSFDFQDKTILDVGCGYGDFYLWLISKGIVPKKYIGVDLMPEHCRVAKEKLPESCQIVEGDFLTKNISAVDVAVLSGTLNAEFENWLDISRSIIDKMWNLSSEGIIFNMQSSHGLEGEYKLKVMHNRNIDPAYWCTYAHERTCKYGLYHDYMHYDYTIAMWKAEAGWQETNEK